jgi:hypothetical protein
VPDVVVYLTAATLGLGLLAGFIRATVYLVRLLNTIEGHTKELTTNGGGHLADAVRRTESKVDGLTEEQAAVRVELATQQSKVAEELKEHRGETAIEFGKVWRELATREIHKSADLFLDEATRVERTKE